MANFPPGHWSPMPSPSQCHDGSEEQSSEVLETDSPETASCVSPDLSVSDSSFSMLSIESTNAPWSPSDSTQEPTCSEQFWFEDGSVVIKVEDTLYNVHKSLLKSQSDFFRSKLADLDLNRSSLGSRWNPCTLDVDKLDFEMLLKYIYPLAYESKFDYTASEWLAILSISTELKFISIRKVAIDRMSQLLTLVDRLLLGRMYDVTEWFPTGYRLLCLRDEPLSVEEGKSLGFEDVVKIARAREMLAKGVDWTEVEKLFV